MGGDEDTTTLESTTGKSHTTLADSHNSRLAVWCWLHMYLSTIPETTPHLSSVPETVLGQHMPVGRNMKVKEKCQFHDQRADFSIYETSW